jgi:phosphoribosyl-ATP pyrophosphohydrolase/phosphoribosyl-AMP cyclohydrolase
MIDMLGIAWDKVDGLIPAIIQDRDGLVRMLGYMDHAALTATLETGYVTFFSRSKGRLWVKGETSGNRLRLLTAQLDCDGDALLVIAEPEGPTCHTGSVSCFGDAGAPFFPSGLEAIISDRANADPASSYTAGLIAEGVKRIAQKVGEEGVEVAIAAIGGEQNELISEIADLAYHLTVLLHASGQSWSDVASVLEQRHKASSATASS